MAFRLQPALLRAPRELTIAAAVGLGVGAFATAVAYGLYQRAHGPTWAGVAIIPLSVLVMVALHVGLTRRRHARASDWLVLGYTAAMILSTVLFTVQQALHDFYTEFTGAAW